MMKGAVAFFLFAVCVIYLYAANGFAVGTLSNPKAGFLPLIVGWLGVVFAGINAIQVFRAGWKGAGTAIEIRRVSLFAVGLVAYAALIGFAGFFISTCLILFFLLKLSNPKDWKVCLTTPVAVSVLLYVTFTYVLTLPLP